MPADASVMRCLLVDDEELARVELRRLLANHPEIEIVGEAANVGAALDLAARLRPEVIFLDIQLRGETAFDFIGRAPEPPPPIVFVTAFDQYAIRGFECNALDYLLKPVHPDRLAETIRRLRRHERFLRPAEADDAVLLKVGSTARFVPWREIHHVVTEGNYTRVVMGEGTALTVLRSLKAWTELAPSELFLQIHRTALVRRTAIREIVIVAEGRREVVLSDGTRLPVGRTYVAGLKTLGQFRG